MKILFDCYFQGSIETQGKYNEIFNSGIDIASMLTKCEEVDEDELVEDNEVATIKQKNSTTSLKNMINSAKSLNSEKSESKEKQSDPEEEKELLGELEASSKGKVKGSIYLNYFKSANRPFTLVYLVITLLLSQILASVIDIWVAYW